MSRLELLTQLSKNKVPIAIGLLALDGLKYREQADKRREKARERREKQAA
jgi:hypothetical protein